MSSYFYPVSAGLFIEDRAKKEQMVVMNDRAQGGSAYSQGRIELMFHRLGTTNDELGIWEPMKDISPDGRGINVTAKYFLAFTNNRETLYKMI